jgi:hypothetical protein
MHYGPFGTFKHVYLVPAVSISSLYSRMRKCNDVVYVFMPVLYALQTHRRMRHRCEQMLTLGREHDRTRKVSAVRINQYI